MNNIENYLNTLSNMLKKRENQTFGKDLRNELLRRANTMNAATQSEDIRQKTEDGRVRWRFSVTPFMKKALATSTAFALLLGVVFYSILPGGGGQVVQLVNIAEAQDYYTLTPVSEDTSGIDSGSGFILDSKGTVDAGEVEEALVITPETAVEVEQLSDTSVQITPVEPLQDGEVYSVQLDAQNMESSPYKTEYSWAYQVSENLRISGTLPSNQSTSVPIDTGIEINFNYNGINATDFTNFYSIEPAVKGGWDAKGKTAVFIPGEDLAEMTIYTMTIKAGLPLSGSDKTLSEDYTFQFETSGESRDTGNLSFARDFYNFGTAEESIAMQLYYWTYDSYGNEPTNPIVSLQVYTYKSGDDFADALVDRQENVINWSSYSSAYEAPVDGLDLIIDAPETPLGESDYDYFLSLPQKLDTGYYLVKISMDDSKTEAFLQVNDLATYVSLSSNKSLVWVNDLATGKTVPNAEVEISGIDSANTNSDGVAEFDNAFPEIKTYNDSEESSKGIITVTSGESKAYYTYDYWNNFSNNDYWQFFETERETYHPTDKIYYWGFLKGRSDSVSGDAKLIITTNSWVWDAKYLAENDLIFYSEDIEIKDGDVFKGELDIDTFAPGYYALEIVKDDTVISTTSFSVEDFVKPAYEITVEPAKRFLFSGEKINVDVTASFFEGTPVSNLDLQGYYGAKGSNGEEQFTTDDNGKISITYTADNNSWCEVFSYCDLFYTDYLSVTPVNEEEGDIWGEAQVTTINSLVGAQEIAVDYDKNLTLQTKYVDVDKLNENTGWLSASSDVYGEIAPNTKVVVTVLKKEQVKTEIGQYYDYINKVTRTEYEYSEVDVSTDTLTLTTDSEGNLNYDLGLDPTYLYQIDVAIYDTNENYYRWQTYLYSQNEYYGQYYYGDYYSFEGVEDSYDIGSTVDLSITSSREADMTTFNYLYLQSQDGTSEYEASAMPAYSFKFTDEMVPNIMVSAVLFDGKNYYDVSSGYINYDSENKRLTIDISADKDSYEPGDEVTLDIKTSDQSSVNLYLVDEAYYSLFAESITDPLTQLYGRLSDGILYRFASTQAANMDTSGKGGCFKAGTQILMADGSYKNIEDIKIGDRISTRVNPLVNELVSGNVVKTYEHYVGEYLLVNDTLGVTSEHIMFINGQWNLASELKIGDVLIDENGDQVAVQSIEKISEPTYVYNFEVEKYHTYFADGIYVHNDKGGTRAVLKDTALFEVIETDSSGNGSVTFTLPDNITSWRVVASAINGDKLEAGLSTINIDVTRPVIVLPVISSEYLVGDQPSIPVRAYGDYLTADTPIYFGMESEDLGYEQTADGVAYKNTYFSLGALTEGKKEITTWAETEGQEEGDSLLLTTNVVASHFAINEISNSVLTEGIDLEGSSDRRTDVTFVNDEVGAFYDILISSSYNDGDRADQLATKYVAQKLLNEYFGEEFDAWEFPTFNYQSTVGYGEDGGIALLNYDSSRLELSAKLAALDSSLWDENSLKSYFESFLLTASELDEKGYYAVETEYTLNEKIMAIYGLASLDESYLTELNYLVANNELTLEDKIYTALAYLQFGSKDQAQDLYLDIMQNYSEADSDYILVTDDGASLDNELSWTSLVAVMAAEIGDDNAEGLWKFVAENDNSANRGRSELVDIEKLLYAKGLLEMGADAKVSFKLNGEKITLEGNDVYTVSMLPEELSSTKFSAIDGSVRVITDYEEIVDPSTLDTDSSLSITRKYFVDGNETNILKAGDLVEIQLTATVPGDVEGIYSITDYLPSGLRLTHSDGWHFDQGQAVSFGFGYNPFEPENYSEWELCNNSPDGVSICSYYSTYEEYVAAGGEAVTPSSNAPYTEIITYTARVINKGVFIAEPAVIQDAEDPSIMNVSGKTGSVVIE